MRPIAEREEGYQSAPSGPAVRSVGTLATEIGYSVNANVWAIDIADRPNNNTGNRKRSMVLLHRHAGLGSGDTRLRLWQVSSRLPLPSFLRVEPCSLLDAGVCSMFNAFSLFPAERRRASGNGPLGEGNTLIISLHGKPSTVLSYSSKHRSPGWQVAGVGSSPLGVGVRNPTCHAFARISGVLPQNRTDSASFASEGTGAEYRPEALTREQQPLSPRAGRRWKSMRLAVPYLSSFDPVVCA